MEQQAKQHQYAGPEQEHSTTVVAAAVTVTGYCEIDNPIIEEVLVGWRLIEVADAVAECVDTGARVINLSIAVASPSPNKEKKLEESLSYAAHHGAIVVAAAGNQGTIGSSAITRHVWVIPVAACDLRGQPIGLSNLGASIGRRGLRAPGEAVTSLGIQGEPVTSGGTSAAAPFVTGTVALLWSVFPAVPAAEIRRAITQAGPLRRTIVPPLLNAWAVYQALVLTHSRRTTA